MKRMNICITFCFLLGSSVAFGQIVERIYPEVRTPSLLDATITKDGICYVSGVESTLMRSTDKGNSWIPIALNGRQVHFVRMVTDGTDLFFLGSPYLHAGPAEERRQEDPLLLYRYDTENAEFTHVSIPVIGAKDSIRTQLYSLAATSNTLYLSYYGDITGAIFSTDKGESWDELALPDSLRNKACEFYGAPGSEDIIIKFTSSVLADLLVSTDEGRTWNTIGAPTAFSIKYGRSSLVYLGEGKILLVEYISGKCLLHEPAIGWKEKSRPEISELSALTSLQSGQVVAVGKDGRVCISDNDADEWSTIYQGNDRSMLRLHSSVIGVDENTMIVANSMGEILLTADCGISWNDWRAESWRDMRVLWADGDNAVVNMFQWKEHQSSYFYTDDNYSTFGEVVNVPGQGLYPITSTHWYAVNNGGGRDTDTLIHQTRDGGLNWTDAYVNSHSRLLAGIVPATCDSLQLVVAATKGLLYTSDGGTSWKWALFEEWSNDIGPIRLDISPFDGAIWYTLEDSSGINKVYRCEPQTGVTKVALELSEEDRDKVYHISSIRTLKNGSVLAICVKKPIASRREKNLLVYYSTDNGHVWQSYETLRASTNCEIKRSAGAYVLPNGTILTEYMISKSVAGVTHISWYASDDFGKTDFLVFETVNVADGDMGSEMTYGHGNQAFYSKMLSTYRMKFDNTSAMHSIKASPLPLSIATPYPHPVPKAAGSVTLSIQSEWNEHVKMTVHDLNGRELKLLYSGELAHEGRYVTWITEGLTPGTYLLQLTSSEGVCRRKVLVE